MLNGQISKFFLNFLEPYGHKHANFLIFQTRNKNIRYGHYTKLKIIYFASGIHENEKQASR